MSKWRKALKNKRRFDARYFLSETIEKEVNTEEPIQEEEEKNDFHDFSFDSWLAENTETSSEELDEEVDSDEESLEEFVVAGEPSYRFKKSNKDEDKDKDKEVKKES
tara:strand:- start:28 stop:348 length:321 start_codon:yes stop_codon:yes gene_type:complete